MLYTRKGDNGTTKLFNCPQGQRVSKTDDVFEVLGTLDELNSLIGYAKVLSKKAKNTLVMDGEKIPYENILEKFQQSIFSIQAETGGSEIRLNNESVLYLEKVVADVELVLPPIKSFIVAGGGESGAWLDVSRTIARRTERQFVKLLHKNKKEDTVDSVSARFLNRLSSALYALARFANHQEGYLEHPPSYN
ncbi:MAG: cob(I)yrinic acid a,c-diamide adenosyltransferase [Patescibacteria group bacterium]